MGEEGEQRRGAITGERERRRDVIAGEERRGAIAGEEEGRGVDKGAEGRGAVKGGGDQRRGIASLRKVKSDADSLTSGCGICEHIFVSKILLVPDLLVLGTDEVLQILMMFNQPISGF